MLPKCCAGIKEETKDGKSGMIRNPKRNLSIFVTVHFEFTTIETLTVKLGFNSSIALTSPVFSVPFEGVLAGSVLQEVSGIDFCTAQRDQWGMA